MSLCFFFRDVNQHSMLERVNTRLFSTKEIRERDREVQLLQTSSPCLSSGKASFLICTIVLSRYLCMLKGERYHALHLGHFFHTCHLIFWGKTNKLVPYCIDYQNQPSPSLISPHPPPAPTILNVQGWFLKHLLPTLCSSQFPRQFLSDLLTIGKRKQKH